MIIRPSQEMTFEEISFFLLFHVIRTPIFSFVVEILAQLTSVPRVVFETFKGKTYAIAGTSVGHVFVLGRMRERTHARNGP